MKIVVIDDDPATTDLLRMMLEPLSAEIKHAESGPRGIQLVRNENPDLVILDLMMPEINGWHVCRVVREFSRVPILILSALDIPSLVAAALDAGADDYLIKPVSANLLLAQVNKLLRRNRLLHGVVSLMTI